MVTENMDEFKKLDFSANEEMACERDGGIAYEYCGITPCDGHVGKVR
jgi:hypothetical protein